MCLAAQEPELHVGKMEKRARSDPLPVSTLLPLPISNSCPKPETSWPDLAQETSSPFVSLHLCPLTRSLTPSALKLTSLFLFFPRSITWWLISESLMTLLSLAANPPCQELTSLPRESLSTPRSPCTCTPCDTLITGSLL